MVLFHSTEPNTISCDQLLSLAELNLSNLVGRGLSFQSYKMSDDEYGGANDSYFEYTRQYQNYLLFSVAVFAVEFLSAVIGVVANCIVCGVLLRQKRLLRNFSNFDLFNLGITDIIFRLALTPVLLTIEYTAVKHGSNAICKLGAFGS